MQPDVSCRVLVEATVSPSEDVEKVAVAVSNVVAGAQGVLEKGGQKVRFLSSDIKCLRHLRDQLRDRHVRATARRMLLSETEESGTSIMLNRQAAAVGVLALCDAPEESPLGPIYLTIESKALDSVIDWLTAYEVG